MTIIFGIPVVFATLKRDQFIHIIHVGLSREISIDDIDDVITDYHEGHRNRVRQLLKHFNDDDILHFNQLLQYRRGRTYSTIRVSIDGDRIIIN